VKRGGEFNERVDGGVDVEEVGKVKGRLVEGSTEVSAEGSVDGDVDKDEGWDENPEGLIGKLGGLVDEVEDGWKGGKEVEGGLTDVVAGRGWEEMSGVSGFPNGLHSDMTSGLE
jgi:hypothetical protein